jgi:hypothetical protein
LHIQIKAPGPFLLPIGFSDTTGDNFALRWFPSPRLKPLQRIPGNKPHKQRPHHEENKEEEAQKELASNANSAF